MINTGISFGIELPLIEWWSLGFIVTTLILWAREKGAWGWVVMSLGGMLNLEERILRGGVRDYWQIPGTTIYNNLKDYLILAGAIQVVGFFIWKIRQK